MLLSNNRLFGYEDRGYDSTITSGSTLVTTGGYYNYGVYNPWIEPAEPAEPKKKTFEDKLQDEINDWLSIFK